MSCAPSLLPDPSSSSSQPRPQAAAWKKLEESREYKSGNVLREYQLEGVNWLLFNWYNRYMQRTPNSDDVHHQHN